MIAQDRLHDTRSQKAKLGNAGEVRASDTCFPGEVVYRSTLGTEHHLPIAVRLGEDPRVESMQKTLSLKVKYRESPPVDVPIRYTDYRYHRHPKYHS